MPNSAETRDDLPSADDAPCGMVTTDDRGKFLQVNRLFCQWVGRSRDALVQQCRLQEFFTVGSRMFMQTHWAPLMHMQGSISEVKVELVCADGSTMPIVVNAVSRERAGAVVHNIAMFVARDRDRYEKELLATQARLQQLVAEEKRLMAEARDRASYAEQMVGIVSHDLRNPLSAVQLGTTALARTNPTPQQQRILDRINRSTNRANRLIADLLDFTAARLGSGISVHLEPIDPHLAIADAVEELTSVFPQRQIRHVRIGDGERQGDADRLLQLVGNLVANAVTYGDAGAPVTVTSTVTEGGYTVTVHNFGPPIPEDRVAKLFQPMVRGIGAGEASSVGLGLYIVESIAKAHTGSVAVESEEASGTTFTCTFPSL